MAALPQSDLVPAQQFEGLVVSKNLMMQSGGAFSMQVMSTCEGRLLMVAQYMVSLQFHRHIALCTYL